MEFRGQKIEFTDNDYLLIHHAGTRNGSVFDLKVHLHAFVDVLSLAIRAGVTHGAFSCNKTTTASCACRAQRDGLQCAFSRLNRSAVGDKYSWYYRPLVRLLLLRQRIGQVRRGQASASRRFGHVAE